MESKAMLPSIPASQVAAAGSRSRLLTGCAIAVALAAVAQAPRARAQASPDKSFQGTGSVAFGNASINQTGTQDTITLNSSQAAIDWRLDNEGGTGPINFLPEGRTGLFTSGEVSNFVVLNRIVPTDQTRGIRLDGTVRSQVRSAAGAPVTGGSVWFYSPGGIIAGASSLFDVGSLLLTTNAIDISGGLFGPGGEIRFRGAEGSQSTVQIDAGARIRALATNSYVALVAPRIVQNGNVQVDGSAGYVAAEAADVTINNGLFDIRFVTGTTAENAITHGGTTTGPASTGVGDNHRIYMAAVAKNDAVSMLLGGTIGYEPASSVAVENGVVVLSAGYATVGGDGVDTASATGGDGNIEIGNSAFLSRLTANASGSILVNPGGPAGAGRVRFDADATLTAVNSVVAATENANESISAFGDLTLRATGTGTGAQRAAISALGNETGYGGIFVNGRLTVDASGIGASAGQLPGPGGAGVGGTASVDVAGTRLSADSLYVQANGIGGNGTDVGGNGRGGSASVSLADGDIAVNREVNISAAGRGGTGLTAGGIGVGGSTALALSGDSLFNANLRGTVEGSALLLDSSGIGGGDFRVPPATGGAASGGDATISVDGGLLLVPGSVQVDAGATGGFGSAVSGAATAGAIDVTLDGGDATLDQLTLSANAEAPGNFGSETGTAGAATGGDVALSVSNGTLTSSFGVSIGATANTYSSTGLGTATGGTIDLSVGPGGGLFAGTALSLSADAYASSFSGIGRNATGGDIAITLGGGQLGAAELIASAVAFAGSGVDAGGVGTGGSVTIEAGAASSLTVGTRTQIDVGGTGGSGLNRDPGGLPTARPGAGNGGTVRIATEGSTIALGETARIDASGHAGNAQAEGVAGPGAFGGLVDIDLDGGGLSFGSLDIVADGGSPYSGEGGFSNGNGGVGNGGTVTINTVGASLTGTSLSVSAQGYGGPAFDDYVGGTGTGGTISVTTNGAVDIGTIGLTADGIGGAGENGATGGIGRGGSVTFDILAGSFDSSVVGLSAAGYGGAGGDAFEADAGDGGDGFGGTTRFTIATGALADIGELRVLAIGIGGVGGDVGYFDSGYGDDYGFADQNGGGGNGSGGIVTINIAGGTDATDLISIGSLTASTAARGGAGGTFVDFGSSSSASPGGFSPFALGGPGSGGDATGGSTSVTIAYDGIDLGATLVDASAIAGAGATGIEGGAGGSAIGGTALFDAVHAELALANLQVLATATAGAGADSLGFGGAGGDGGNATGGTATIRAQTVDTRLTLGIVTLSTDAVAGAAGDGSVAAIGGNGGVGGIAIGGTSAVSVEDAALLFDNSPFGDPLPRYTITARATGGAGGIGADGTDFGDTGGFGGIGGAATGGTARIGVAGGSVTGPGLTLNANAMAGLGGLGGTGATFPGEPGGQPPIVGVTKLQALSGTGTGGTAALSVGDNASFGSMTFGATTLTATGTGAGGAQPGASIGGLISIRDTSSTPAGSLLLASLDAQAGPFGGGGFQLYSADGPVRVTGDATIDVGGQIRIEGAGAGGLSVGGTLDLFTNADIAVLQTGPLSSGDPFVTIRAGTIIAESFTGFVAGPGSRIVSTGSTRIDAHSGGLVFDTIIAGGALTALAGTIDGTTAESGGNAFFSALGDVALRSVTTTGETGYGNITVNAGGSASAGTLDAFGRLTIEALGNLVGLPDPGAPDPVGAVLIAGTDIAVTTGVDAQILSANAGDEIDLDIGGRLSFGTLDAAGSIETASVDGTVGDSVTAGTSAFLQSGLAGLRLGSVTTGTSAALNSTGAVSLGAGSAGGDFGAQGASVTAGVITTTGASDALGNIVLIAAEGDVQVDQANAFGSVALQATANVGAGTLDAGAHVLLLFGGDATIDSATATGIFLAQGSGALNFTTIDAGLQASFDLGGALEGGTILSGGVTEIDASDVFLTALSSDGLATVNSGGLLQIDSITTPLGGSFTASGDLIVGALSSGGLLSLDGLNVTVLSDITDAEELAITTQNDLTLQNVTLAGDFDVVVPGAIGAGTITSGGDIRITATQIDLAGAFARYSVNLSAQSTVAVGAGSAGDDFLIDTGGDVTLGAITTTGAETGYGGEGGVGSNIDISTLGTLRARSLDAFDRLTIDAATLTGNPPVEGRGEGGAVLAAGDDIAVTMTGSALIASADAGLSIAIASDDLEFGTLDAGTSINFTATGDIAGDAATAGTGITIGTPEGVTIDSLVAGGAVDLAAGIFDLGSLTANSLLIISVGGGSIDLARTIGDFTIQTDANVTLGDIASSAGAIDVTAGNISGGSLVAATNLSLDGDAIAFGTIRSGGATDIIVQRLLDLGSAQSGTAFTAHSLDGAIDIDTLTAGGFARVTTDIGAIRVGQINTPVGGLFDATADLTVGGLNSGGLLTLDGFNVTVLSDITDANILSITTQNNLTLQNVTLSGDFGVTVPGALTAGTITSGGDIIVDAGAIDLAGAFARYSVDLTATGGISVGTGSAGDDFLVDAGGDVFLGDILTTGAESGYGGEGGFGSNIIVTAGGDIVAGSLDAFDAIGIVGDGDLVGVPVPEGRGEGGSVLVAGGDIDVMTGGNQLIASATAGGSIGIGADALEFGTLTAADGVTIGAAGDVAGDAIDVSGGSIGIDADGSVTVDELAASGSIGVSAGAVGTGITIGTLQAGNTASLTSLAGIRLDDGRSTGNFSIRAEGDVVLGAVVTSGSEFGYGATIAIATGGSLTAASLDSAGQVAVDGDGGIMIDSLAAAGFARVTGGAGVTVDSIDTPVGGSFSAVGDLTVGGLNSGGLLTLDGFNVTVLSDITDADALSITTQNDLTLQDVTLAGDFAVTVPGALTAGTVTSGGDILVDAGAIDLAGAFARYSVDLTAITTVSVGSGRAGDDFLVDAGGAVSLGSIVTTGAESGYGGEGGPDGSNIIVTAGDFVAAGRLQAFDDIDIEADGGLTGIPSPTGRGEGGAVLVSGGDIEVTTGDDALIASATAGDEIDFDIGGGLEFGTLVAGRSIESTSGGATAGDSARSGTSSVFNAGAAGLTLDSLTAGTSAALNSSGTVTLGTATVGGDFGVGAGDAVLGSITTTGTAGNLAGNIVLIATGDLGIDSADAFGSIGIQTGGTLTADTLDAGGSIALIPAGDATLGSARAGTAFVAQGAGALAFGSIEAGTSIEMVVGGLTGDSITAGTTLAITADDVIAIATLIAGGQATVTGGSDVSIGSIETASGGSFTAAGDLVVGALSSGGLLSLDGFNVTVLSDITDAQDLAITTDNDLTLQNVTLSGDFGVTVPGALTAGTITSGGDIIVDAGAIDLAGAFARYSVDLTAITTVSVGSGRAGDDFLVDAGGDVFLGDIVTTGAESGYGGEGGFGSNIIVSAGGDIVAGSLDAFDAIGIVGDGDLVGVPVPEGRGEGGSVLVAGGDIDVMTGGNQLIASATAGGSIGIGADALEFGTFTAADGVTIGAAGDVAGDAIDVSGGSIGIDAAGSVTVDELAASGSIGVSAGAVGTGITIGTLQAGNTASLTSLAGIRLDDGRSTGSFSIRAEGDVVLGAVVTSGSEFGYGATIAIATGGSLTAASLDSAGQVAVDGDGGIMIDSLAAAGFARVTGGAGVTVDSIDTPVGGSFSAVGDLTVGGLNSGGLLTLDGFNVTVLSDITDADALSITTQNDLTLQDVTLAGDFAVTVPGALTAGTVTSGGDILVDAGAIDLAGAFARYSVDLTAITTVSVGSGRAGDDFLVDAGGAVSLGSIVTTGAESGYGGEGGPDGSNIIVTAGDFVAAGRLQAFDDIDIEADGGLTGIPSPTGRGEGGAVLVSGGDIEVTTGDDALIASATAGDEIDFDIGGGLEFGTLVAGRSIESTSGGATAGDSARSGTSSVFNAGAAGLTLDSLTAGTSAALNSSGTVTLGTATVGGDFGVGAGDAVLGSITTTGTAGNLAGNIVLIATGDLGIDSADAFGSIGIQTGGTLTADTLDASGSIALIPAGDATLGSARAGTAFVAQGTGALAFGSIEAGTSIEMVVGGLTGDSITAGTTLAITADDVIAIATLTAGGQATVTGGSDVSIGSIETASGGSFTAAGDLIVGALSSGGLLSLDGFNVTVLSDITDAQNLAITTDNDLTLQNVTLSGDFGVTVPGALTAGTITSGGDIIVDAGAIDLAGAFARYSVDLTAITAVSVGSGRAGDDFLVDAGGDVFLGDIVTTGAESGYGGEGGNDGSNIVVTAGGDVFAGSLAAFDAIGIDAGGDLTGFDGSGAPGGGNGGGTDQPIGEDALGEGGAVLMAGGGIGVTTGGSATILSAEAGFDIDILTGSFVDFGTLDAGSDVRISAQGVDGGSVTAGDDVDILSGLAVAIGTVSAGDEARASAGTQGLLIGTITAGSAVTIASLGTASITDGTAGDGDFIVDADGDVTLGTILALGESGYGGEGGAGNILVGSGGLVTVGSATAFGAIDIDAEGDISGTSFVAGDTLTVNGRGRFTAQSVRVTGETGSGNAAIDALAGIDIRTLAAAGDAAFTATGGDIAVTDDIAVNGIVTALGRTVLLNALGGLRVGSATATAGGIDIAAGLGLAVDAGSATGGIALASSGGSVTVGTLTTIAGDGAGDIAIAAADDVLLDGAVTARGALAVDAGDLIRVSALADGTSVTLGSNDIEIGAQGRVGTIGKTTLVDITNTGGRRTFIGGGGGNAGFDLSAAEIARIFSDDIFIHAPPVATQGGQSVGSSRAPDVIVGSFTLTSRAGTQGGNLGSGGTFGIDTTGKLRVVGDALFTGLGADNRVDLVADDALEVDSRTGSIQLNGGGGLAGTLILTSADIFVGTLEALADIAAAPDMAAIDERLGLNDGVIDEGGAIQAGGLEVNAGNGVFVQNSGVESRNLGDRRGFTVGTGGLTIRTGGGATRIVINGREVDPATNGFFTGVDLIPRVRILGADGDLPGAFDQGSTINGCVIANTASCQIVVTFPVQDVIQDITDPSQVTVQPLQSPLIQLRGFERFGFQPLIDEPVTGAGNDDLWTGQCGNDPRLPDCALPKP
ncbi:beta strand repeat-containing protein [Sphingomonas sanxanigenens]|uniref:Filamentous haemagglutinin FhaB/tRNA nuclease CdiA-like TPS domain-containing protein n=1 Tax=Sphingomonas sanxanigenens DSM 19645 = NX02 TaxID=1123269 RepID=W0ADC1_9SPHN|nr:hypothetical protein [Sphingomonas sanxanigenens]AHE54522.1 hypothetical protein NX02_14175 [Sphingomonas sanxanigenens DSM 19645 = NX02]